MPAAATSADRVLMSEWDEAAIREWFTPEVIETSGAKTKVHTADQLLEELARIRHQGYATVDEEFEHGVVGCSAPVRDFNGRIVAAINTTAPKARLGHRLDMAGHFVAGAAQQLTQRLSVGPPNRSRMAAAPRPSNCVAQCQAVPSDAHQRAPNLPCHIEHRLCRLTRILGPDLEDHEQS